MRDLKPTSPIPRSILVILVISIVYTVLYTSYTSVLLGKATYAHHTPEQAHLHTQVIAYALNVDADIGFLTSSEQEHMYDVRRVMTWLAIAFAFALGVAIGTISFYAWRLREYALLLVIRSAWWAGLSIIVICALLGILSLLDFNAFWTGFHHIFFPQGNWQFARDSTLITLYPEWFYLWCTKQVVLRTAIVGIVLAALGGWGLRAAKRV